MISIFPLMSEAPLMASPSPVRHSQAIDPNEWNAWIGLGTAVGAGALWIWRHSLGAFCVWMWNFIQAPKLIKEQNVLIGTVFKEINDAKAHAEYAVVTSRIAWSFIDRPVLQFDSLGNCVFANDFAQRILVRQQSEFLGSGWLTLVHNDDSERIERQWKNCVNEKRNFVHEFRVHNRNGDVVKVFDRAEVMYDKNDNVLGWYHLMTVIHD